MTPHDTMADAPKSLPPEVTTASVLAATACDYTRQSEDPPVELKCGGSMGNRKARKKKQMARKAHKRNRR